MKKTIVLLIAIVPMMAFAQLRVDSLGYVKIINTTFHGQYIHYHTEIKPGVVFTVNNRLNFYNGSKLKICNGSVLEIVENGFLNNVILEIEPGSKIYLKEGGKIKLASENSFSPPIGTIVEIENGEIY